MKQREKILAIGVGASLLMVGLRAAALYYDETYTQRQNELATLDKKFSDQDLVIRRGMQASKSFRDWQGRALPADRSTASSLYQKWLLEIAKKAGLKDPKITSAGTKTTTLTLPRNMARRQTTPGTPTGPTTYQCVGYTLVADASLTEVVRLLYEFYSANHLHRVTKLEVALPKSGSNLSLILAVEGLMLPGSTNTDKLSTAKSERLELADLAAYEKSIVGRNLFAEYKPPAPPPQPRVEVRRDPPPTPPAFDKAKHATLTGIVEQGGEAQLSVYIKTTGEKLDLAEGEEFTIGDLKCKVVRINLRDAELATGDKHFVVKLGENLRDASTRKSSDL